MGTVKVLPPGRPEPADSIPGQAPHLAQSHTPWAPCCCRHRSGEGGGKAEVRSAPPRLAPDSCFPSKALIPACTGLGPGASALPAGPTGSASTQAPIPQHHMTPNQTKMGRRQKGDKIEGSFNYSEFQPPPSNSGAKRTGCLVYKRHGRSKLVFTLILMVTGESLMGTPHTGTEASLLPTSAMSPQMVG